MAYFGNHPRRYITGQIVQVALLNSKFENFKMEHETVKDMFSRLTTIVYNARALSKDLLELELVNKILRVLPKAFKSKIAAIQESKELKSVKLHELIGSLLVHELEMKTRGYHVEPKKKSKALSHERVSHPSVNDKVRMSVRIFDQLMGNKDKSPRSNTRNMLNLLETNHQVTSIRGRSTSKRNTPPTITKRDP